MAAGLTLVGCKPRGPELMSEPKQIFSEPQRDDPKAGEAPYVMQLERGCTAFFLDPAGGIGMTAMHCGVDVGSRFCVQGAGGWAFSDCPAADVGAIDLILETSPVGRLDYVIFRAVQARGADWMERAKGIKISGKDDIQAMLEARSEVRMFGYPADKYREAKLTVSWGRVRSAVLAESPMLSGEKGVPRRERNEKLLTAWKRERDYHMRPDYREMREECWIIDADPRAFRPSFRHDLSTYGGNSGGPMVANGAVVAMPATYYPEPDGSNWDQPCFERYWSTYFAPVLGQEEAPKEPWGFENWNTLDRAGAELKDFPLAIPMHLVANSSAYLREHPEYVAR